MLSACQVITMRTSTSSSFTQPRVQGRLARPGRLRPRNQAVEFLQGDDLDLRETPGPSGPSPRGPADRARGRNRRGSPRPGGNGPWSPARPAGSVRARSRYDCGSSGRSSRTCSKVAMARSSWPICTSRWPSTRSRAASSSSNSAMLLKTCRATVPDRFARGRSRRSRGRSRARCRRRRGSSCRRPIDRACPWPRRRSFRYGVSGFHGWMTMPGLRPRSSSIALLLFAPAPPSA